MDDCEKRTYVLRPIFCSTPNVEFANLSTPNISDEIVGSDGDAVICPAHLNRDCPSIDGNYFAKAKTSSS